MYYGKVISTAIESGYRIIKTYILGRDVQTPDCASPFGDDSNPIKDMIAIYAHTGVADDNVIIGYLNKSNLADVGEKRIYSTDSDGEVKFYIWLKNDGTCKIGGDSDNMVRYSKLETAFNELKQDFNTLVTTFNAHVHTGVQSGGSSTATTPTQGQSSNADISPAKINEIKTL